MSVKKIRVLHIITGFAVEGPLGGLERFAIELVRNLDKEQIEPLVFGLWGFGVESETKWVNILQSEGVRCFLATRKNVSSPFASLRQAILEMKKQNVHIDIIHTHGQYADVAALFLKKYFGASILIRTVHSDREWGLKNPLLRRTFLRNLILPLLFKREIGVSQQIVDDLDKRPIAKLLNKKAIRIYNAVDTTRFDNVEVDRKAKLAEFNIPENALVVGTIGRLCPQKGYHLFLDAMNQVIEQNPNIYALMIGDGELKEEIHLQHKQLAHQENIILAGARNDVEQLLPCFDLFVSSSLWEGLPTVIIESMVAKTPVIATNISGNNELVIHNQTGFLVTPHSIRKLAETTLEFFAQPEQHVNTLTKQAYSTAVKTFSISSAAKDHFELYTMLKDIDAN